MDIEAIKEAKETGNLDGVSVSGISSKPYDESIKEQLDEQGQKLYGLVDEIVQLFKSRIDSGELQAIEVSEAISVALTGSVMALIPPHLIPTAKREADSISNYLLKNFNAKSKKKNYMFGSQLLGATRFTSYIVSYGAMRLREIREQGAKIAEEKLKEMVPEESK